MRAICVIAGFFLCLFVFVPEADAKDVADPFPEVSSSYLLRVNGKTLWSHMPNRKLPPASLTKIMTALLVLEKGRLDEVVTISQTAEKETGSRLGIKKGDKMQVGYLLVATLIKSANDACRSLAEHIGESESKFVALMNRRAKQLGMKKTHFTNACGHNHPQLYSTANDLAILAEAALKNKIFSELVKIADTYIPTVDGQLFYIENANQIIGRYPGAIGVKTGYTLNAGKCLIALAERDGVNVLLILLNAPNRWWDAEVMLDKAFSLVTPDGKSP